MPTARVVSAAALLVFALPAAAQLSNRSIALETGVSRSVASGAGADPVVALTAAAWLDGPVEAVARLELASAPRTPGRPQAERLAGTFGARISLLPDPVRPQVSVEVGWARLELPDRTDYDLVLGLGAGVEWFPTRNLSVAARAALLGIGAAASAELLAGVAAYF